MRPINSIIEFKQIIGRGTRLFDGKEYFTIYDFVGASDYFNDKEWDGEPIDRTTERWEDAYYVREPSATYVTNLNYVMAKNRRVNIRLPPCFWMLMVSLLQ